VICSRAAARSSWASAWRGCRARRWRRAATSPDRPDPNAVDSWIAIHADNTATVYTGKCELGQGNTTGLLQIAGEELDLEMSQLKAVQLDTNVTPNQGATSSSSSIHRGGPQVRAAAAEARQALLLLASTKLGVQLGSLAVSKGVVFVDGEEGGRSVKYGALLGDKPFNVKFTGTAPQKPVNRYRLVGHVAGARRHPGQGGRQVHPHAARAGARHAARACGAARGQRAYGQGRNRSRSTKARSRTSRAPAWCARATSSAW